MAAAIRESRVEPELAYEWGREAALSAGRVPAAGREAVDWTVRGWAEIALGCLVSQLPLAMQGLDDIVRLSRIPCAGPYAKRLRALRQLAGPVPHWYFAEEPPAFAAPPLADDVARACRQIGEFCDALQARVSAARSTHAPERGLPLWTSAEDHLRWGERFRPSPRVRQYVVCDMPVPAELVRRSWMRLPGTDSARIVLVYPTGTPAATYRQRIRQGIHNGAHLDHLAACTAVQDPPSSPAEIEFGSGLTVAEAYAMSAEILAAAECLLASRTAEARQLHRGLVSRIGRVPGYREWYARQGRGPRALELADSDRVDEFAVLPTLAGHYLTGPLRLIANGWDDRLIPAGLAETARRRWNRVCERFEPAAVLTARARELDL